MFRQRKEGNEQDERELRERIDFWAESPGQVAIALKKYYYKNRLEYEEFKLLDVGCAFGRDDIYLAGELKARITGIDRSRLAIDIAKPSSQKFDVNVRYVCKDFFDYSGGPFDALLVSNIYHHLTPEERSAFRHKLLKWLKPGGLLFLNAFSTNDPEEYGKGKPVEGEEHSFIDARYHHFFVEDELRDDFKAFNLEELYELNYVEKQPDGTVHNHTSWMLIGRKR